MAYMKLTHDDREHIMTLLTQHRTMRDIARDLHRNVSTVSRQLQRYSGPERPYSAHSAKATAEGAMAVSAKSGDCVDDANFKCDRVRAPRPAHDDFRIRRRRTSGSLGRPTVFFGIRWCLLAGVVHEDRPLSILALRVSIVTRPGSVSSIWAERG
jgi:hypothetical protein